MSLGSDISCAWRLLWRRRWLALTGLAIVVLGLTTTSAMFIILDTLVLEPLPFRDPDQLFVVGPPFEKIHGSGSFLQRLGTTGAPTTVTDAELQEMLRLPGVTAAFGYTTKGASLKQEFRDAEGLRDAGVTPSFFEGLGVHPFVGRAFIAEDVGARPQRALMSYGLWSDRFGRDFGILGQCVTLGGERVEIVGVMPERFNFPAGANLWVASTARIRSQIGVVRVAAGKLPTHGLRLSSGDFLALPLRDYLEPGRDKVIPLTFLFATAGVVLAITWLHLGALRTVQVFDHARETAIRMALGASPGQIVRQQIVESLLFVAIALGAALMVLPSVVRVAAYLLPPSVTLGREAAVDHRGILFLCLATLLGAIGMSAGPIRATTRAGVLALLKNEGQILSGLSPGGRRRAVLIAQVALVSALLYITGLLTTELMRVRQLNLGFDPEGLLIVKLPERNDSVGSALRQSTLLENIAHISGVVACAAGFEPSFLGIMPVTVGNDAQSSRFDGSRAPNAMYQSVSPGYFRTVRTPIIEGREFDWRLDGEGRVVVVSQSLARSLGRARGLSGSTIWINGGRFLVVGVVGDIRANATNEIGERPYLYFLSARSDTILVRVDKERRIEAIDRIKSTVQAVTERADRLWFLDAKQNVMSFLAPHASRVALAGLQTGAALVLGVVGLYSLACEVLRRRLRSAAIRKAFGARTPDILLHISAPVITGAASGLFLGLGLGIAAGWWLSSVALIASRSAAIDIRATSLAITSVLLASLLALVGPARRAARLDPSVLLRFE
jgi:hypothetical protein